MIALEFSLKNFYEDQTRQNTELDDAADDILLEVVINVAKEFDDVENFYGHIYHSLFYDLNGQEDVDDGRPKNEVVLSTIHRTKGNEFNNVAYFNLMKNERLTEISDIEEERRVSYVGITRAIKNIIITAPNNGGFSIFLKEAAFNPEFKNISEINLKNLLAKSRRDEMILSEKMTNIKSKIDSLLEKYPELKGLKFEFKVKTFRKFRFWIRQKMLNSTVNKIADLEQANSALFENEYLPLKDKIEKIEIDLKNREILSN